MHGRGCGILLECSIGCWSFPCKIFGQEDNEGAKKNKWNSEEVQGSVELKNSGFLRALFFKYDNILGCGLFSKIAGFRLLYSLADLVK